MRRGVTALAVLTAVAVLPACNTSSSSRTVSITKAAAVSLPASSHIIVTARPAPAAATVSVTTPVQTPAGEVPSPVVLLGKPLLLHASSSLPPGGATLTFTIKRPRGAAGPPFIASYDPSTGSWTPVASHYDSASHAVSATLPHFSIWGVLSFVTSGLEAIVKGALQSIAGLVKFNGPVPRCSEATSR